MSSSYIFPFRRTIDLIGFPGELFMNLLKALILPLIAASLVSGLAEVPARQSGLIGVFAALYYTITLVGQGIKDQLDEVRWVTDWKTQRKEKIDGISVGLAKTKNIHGNITKI